MAYRTVEIRWRPQSRQDWAIFTSSRKEAARLWGDLVERHFRIRRSGKKKWPDKTRWCKWAKRNYALNAQSIQQIIMEFCEAIESARQLHKQGDKSAKYPWKKPIYRDVIYTNQAARVRDGWLLLPNGSSGTLKVKWPDINPEGRLMEARLCFGRILLTYQIADKKLDCYAVIGVDLGVNTLIAATDGKKAVLISGRGAKSIIRYRNKKLSSLQAKQSKLSKGSRRWKRLARCKHKMLNKCHAKLHDTVHKATRLIANEFPNAKCYVGKPFNDAARKMGRVQAQQVSSACCAKIIRLLDYKTYGAIEVNEAYSSQTCPVCGVRSKHKRTFLCKCGIKAPRDVIGGTNIRCIGMNGKLLPGQRIPSRIKYLHVQCSSSGGCPASSPRKRELSA